MEVNGQFLPPPTLRSVEEGVSLPGLDEERIQEAGAQSIQATGRNRVRLPQGRNYEWRSKTRRTIDGEYHRRATGGQ